MISKTDICVGHNRRHYGDSTFRANPEGTLYNGLYWKALPERYMKGVEGFRLLKYKKGRGNLSIQSVKRPYRAKRWHFMAVKTAGKRSSFVINSYF